jgi:ligand-binding sensor domain-containing protein/serine phosphatase RsbU (regulator of sigma subunit)
MRLEIFPDRIKINSTLLIILSHLFQFLTVTVYSQNVRFQSLSVNEGLCHPFVYNINQDKNGFIWIGTGEGLCRYDGIEFVSSGTFDTIPVDVVNVSYRDSLGKLWFGFNNGQVWSYDGNYFTAYTLVKDQNISITGITQSSESGILIATQNHGILQFNESGNVTPLQPSLTDLMLSSIHVNGHTLLVGAQEGLFICDLNDPQAIPLEVEDFSYLKIQTIKNAYNGNSYWIGTEDDGLFLLELKSDSVRVKKIGEEFNLGNEKIQDILFDSDSNLYVCSFSSGLFKLILDKHNKGHILSVEKFDAASGITTNFAKCVYQDREKNIWLGTYGSGIALQKSRSFGYTDYEDKGISRSILSLAINDSILWLGGERGILQVDKSTGKTTLYQNKGLPADKITSLFYRKGTLWVGTEKHGIYKLSGKGNFTPFFQADNSIGNSINYLTGDDENIYAATKNGIYVISTSLSQNFHYSTLNGLPHNDIEHLFLDDENNLLFTTRTNGIYEINVRGEVVDFFTVGKYELDFNSITQDNSKNIWVSTYGQGVFLLLRDSVVNITVKEGLRSNYCYSIVSDDSLYVWVGHRLGLSRIDISTLRVTAFDSDNGIIGDFNHNAALITRDRKLLFGTTEGLITYDIITGYREKLVPNTNILRVFISDKEYDFRKPIVLPYSAYKLRIEYVGLNYVDPEAVTYQYKLEGYDLDWSETTSLRYAIYPRIEDGEYTFLLKAINSDGTSNKIPVGFTIKVKLPVWKTWWFITLVTITLMLLVIVIIKYRERKQKEIQEYLEQRLDERTREVVEQKEEIEIKNRDITDSITYAQRIQSSILPPIKKLQLHFSGSFIFYQPRDIVSGDFYWFEKIKENKFIIVCADSTGHGVPGAFMSMIGTTLIKDVCMRSDINSPSEILFDLDRELRSTLNQNIDVEQSNDGMDIIVCEIDIRTNYLRYASAMRPMIVYRGGEQIYVKGSRNSVGGQYDKDEKLFKDEGIQLDKGDLIYMFSDGYPDQFGGSVGKKFKMVRLKNLLRDIHQKPMEEQYEYVKSTFNLWKEEFDQVDDVLFMGIKI